MNKINFVNNGQPAINDTNMNLLQTNVENAINEKVSTTDIVNRDFIVVSTTIKSNLRSNFKVLLNTVVNSNGTKLTLNTTNNRITIGSEISNVEVCACGFADNPSTSGYIWGNILKNGISVVSAIVPYANLGGYISCTIPAQTIAVSEGDYFEFVLDSTCGGTIRTGSSTIWLQVKKIN